MSEALPYLVGLAVWCGIAVLVAPWIASRIGEHEERDTSGWFHAHEDHPRRDPWELKGARNREPESEEE